MNSRKSLSNNMRKQTRILTEQIGPNKYNSKLKIRNYDSTDNGEYECRVDGFGGESFKAVTVNGKPFFHFKISLSHLSQSILKKIFFYFH